MTGHSVGDAMADAKSAHAPLARLTALLRTHVIPLFLMAVSPPGVQFLWVVCAHHAGSLTSAVSTQPAVLLSQFPSASWAAVRLAGSFIALQTILLVFLPGARFVACTTPMGNSPTYRLNGVISFFLTHVFLLLLHAAGAWRYGELFDEFGPLLAFLNQFALVATVGLYVRGILTPTNSDSGRSGNGIIWDLWMGTELHPEIAGVSLKQLINCRFALMGWSVAVVSFALKQKEIYGEIANSTLVSAGLQLVYIFKFFWWEGGYFNSVDIIHDRFGFYIFWGCTAFLPSVYTLASLFLTTHPVPLDSLPAAGVFIAGLAAVWANYDTDRQRQAFRACGGREKIWGRPPTMIRANYVTGDGRKHESILLASGWWGVSRHVNYVFEIVLALAWTLPAGADAFLPYTYVAFLTVLLVDRAYRDEIRCRAKYGRFYEEYCSLVPWRMVPGVY